MKTKIERVIRIRYKDSLNKGPGDPEVGDPRTIYLDKDPPEGDPPTGDTGTTGNPSGKYSRDKEEYDRQMEEDEDYGGDKSRVTWGEVLPTGSLGDTDMAKSQISSKMDELVQNAMAQNLDNDPLSKRIAKRLEGLKAPVVDWKAQLSNLIEKIITKIQYKLPSRRFGGQRTAQYGYKRTKEQTECIVVAIDTSGSISDKMVHRFLSETQSIVESFDPQDLYVIFCHTDIYRVDHYLPGEKISDSELKSGGTEFWPPFAWVEKHLLDEGISPSIFIYFTDGYAEFPSPGNYSISEYDDRVIWTILGWGQASDVEIPWGKRLDIILPNKSSEL